MSAVIPDAFVRFLDELTFIPPRDSTKPAANLWQDTNCQTADGRTHIKERSSLYLKADTQVSIAGARQKILHQLRQANHVATDPIADAVLGCIVASSSSGSGRAAFWSELLGHFESTKVSHFFILPIPAAAPPITFDGYSFGTINIDVLKSRCTRAGSDYAHLYASKLIGKVALQSPEFNQRLINFNKLSFEHRLNSEHWRYLVLHYFELISRQHFEFMWARLSRTQVLAAPFGASVLDADGLQREIGRFASRVTIYLEISRKQYGYVVPEDGAVTLNQPGPDSERYLRFKEHREKYRLSEIGDSELGRALYECAGFCHQAVRFQEAGRYDDAALYATIALEGIFSERKSTLEAVCSRTAVLTHFRLAKSYADVEKHMRALYDARSGFVHAGKSVTSLDAESLILYAREVLRSLLFLHLDPRNRKEGYLKNWIKQLDFAIAGIESGRTLDTAFLTEHGILL